MNDPRVEKQPPVPPFVQFCCAAIPQVFDDSLSYYEALCAMWKYLDETRQVVNNNATVTEEQIALYDALKEYVDHYFDNLDVQQEINNKLDQMVQDGSFEPLLNVVFTDYYNQLKDYTDSQLDSKVDKNGTGQITVNNLSQSVKEMMTGGSVAVVGVNSVGTENIINSSINYNQLSTNGKNGAAGYTQKKILNLNWEQGTRHNNGSLSPSDNTIVITEPIDLSVGMEIKVNDGYTAIIYYYDDGTHYFWTGWKQITQLIGSNIADEWLENDVYISVRKSDSSDLTPSEGLDALTVTELQTVTKSGYAGLDSDLQKLVLGKSASIKIKDVVSYGSPLITTINNFGYSNGAIGIQTINRAWLETPIYLPVGTTVTTTSDWAFILIKGNTRYTTSKQYVPNSYTDSYTVENDDYYYIVFKDANDADIGATGNNFLNDLTIQLPNTTAGGEKVVYVSGLGNDSTGDGSKANPFRQITKAITDGGKTIICESGYKYNNLNLANVSNIHIIGSMPTYNTSNKVQVKPYFDNSVELTGNTLDSGKIKIAYVAEEDTDMYDCLVAKTKPLKDSASTRSDGYYCTIFSEGDKDTSHRYIPVLTQDDTAGHFYYDGSYIYINPYSDNDVDTAYLLIDTALESQHTLVNLSQCHNITFENFIFKHGSSYLLRGVKCTGLSVKACEFKGSSQADNLAVLDSDVDVNTCVSYLARNDGYNFHGFGTSVVTKCIGCNCFDDGISHHDKCTHTIIGGEYYGNNKGGISSPTYGCSSDIIGAYTHHNNNYGIMSSSDTTHGDSYVNLNGNLSVYNNIGISLNKVKGVALNNRVTNNTTNIVNNSDVVIY